MPPMMRKRGRPKGTNDTVIGVPAKKRATKSFSKPKLITFLRFHVSLKEKGDLVVVIPMCYNVTFINSYATVVCR